MNKITVLVVDDSSLDRMLLIHILESDPNIQVIAAADSGEKALELLKTLKPDVITMDIVMPKMDGFEVTRKIMHTQAVPIVIISGIKEVAQGFRAVDAGALAILEKPKGIGDPQYPKMAKSIIDTIKVMSEVKVVTRRYTSHESDIGIFAKLQREASQPEIVVHDTIEAVAIGASLGGPQALQEIFRNLPKNFPVPIYVVQHIAAGFIEGLATWLNKNTNLAICMAEHGKQGRPGMVYIAPENGHMEIKKNNIISIIPGLPENGVQPAISRLFRSMAYSFGSHGVGVILTGMGRDGVEGLLLMRQMGAHTIAQDEASSTMFGMPKEAILAGAARQVLPLPKIAGVLEALTATRVS